MVAPKCYRSARGPGSLALWSAAPCRRFLSLGEAAPQRKKAASRCRTPKGEVTAATCAAREPMTLTIDLPPELEKNVRRLAAQSGQDLNAFVLQAVEDRIARAR